MKMNRVQLQLRGNQKIISPIRAALQREKAEAEAMRLIRNKDDMFERYLKKPSTTSVGFLVLEKLHSQSARRSRGYQQRSREQQDMLPQSSVTVTVGSSTRHNRFFEQGGGTIKTSCCARDQSPVLSSQADVQEPTESLVVSMNQTTFDAADNQSANKRKKYDSVSNGQISSIDAIPERREMHKHKKTASSPQKELL